MANDRAKQLAFDTMRINIVNAGLRKVLKPISHRLPYRLITEVPVVGEIHLELPDGQVLTLVSDGCDSLASRVYWHGMEGFEPETIRLFLHLAKSSRTIFDVGAHVGLFALLAAIGGDARDVYAFEPVPRIFDYLTDNITANGVDNITAVSQAVSDVEGEISLHIPVSIRLPATASVLSDYRSETETIKVSATTIDNFVAANHLEGVDLIKIDAEGAEDHVLRGASQIIERDRPAIICEVLYDITNTSLQMIFEDTDYRFFLVTDDALVQHERIIGDKTYFYKNYLFLPEERIPEVEKFTPVI